MHVGMTERVRERRLSVKEVRRPQRIVHRGELRAWPRGRACHADQPAAVPVRASGESGSKARATIRTAGPRRMPSAGEPPASGPERPSRSATGWGCQLHCWGSTAATRGCTPTRAWRAPCHRVGHIRPAAGTRAAAGSSLPPGADGESDGRPGTGLISVTCTPSRPSSRFSPVHDPLGPATLVNREPPRSHSFSHAHMHWQPGQRS